MLWPSGTAFIIALVLTPIIRDIFHAYNVVDRPGFRKVHAYPIPRLGGLAIAAAYAIALIRMDGSALLTNNANADALLWKLLPGAAVILLTGDSGRLLQSPGHVQALAGQVISRLWWHSGPDYASKPSAGAAFAA